MQNFVLFSLTVKGDKTNEFREHWDSMLTETAPSKSGVSHILDYRKKYLNVPPDENAPYYDQKDMGCRIDPSGILRIDAVCNWRAPLFLISAMSAKWADLEFALTCSIEHELYECWHIHGGNVSICEMFFESIFAEEDDLPAWFVRDGALIKWPDWHPFQWVNDVFLHPLPRWAKEPYEKKIHNETYRLEQAAEEIIGEFDTQELLTDSRGTPSNLRFLDP